MDKTVVAMMYFSGMFHARIDERTYTDVSTTSIDRLQALLGTRGWITDWRWGIPFARKYVDREALG